LQNGELGLSTTLAVLLHEIPQELGDFAVLVHAGLSARRALWMNLLSAAVAIAGAIVTLLLGSFVYAQVTLTLLPVTAGGFLYIATVVLMPELLRNREPARALLIALGIGLMATLRVLD
jgi:zinc transporter ZupT